MYSNNDVKKAYFAERYKNNKDKYKVNQNLYWEKKAKEILQRDFVTEEDIRKVYNEYHREYRRKHAEQTKNTTDKFWKKQAEKLKEV